MIHPYSSYLWGILGVCMHCMGGILVVLRLDGLPGCLQGML
jgi:hypothetical protein